MLAQLAYLAARFRWTFGAGAVLALLQNVAVVVGVFAWTGKPVDGIFLAAMLTIIGYTVNDSVVVFDRIRETRNARSTEALGPVVDTAIINVLPRTINTGISTLFILAALLFLGGDSLADFALALLLGILVGTYSSNLTAAPLLVELEQSLPGAAAAARSGPRWTATPNRIAAQSSDPCRYCGHAKPVLRAAVPAYPQPRGGWRKLSADPARVMRWV